MLDIERLIGEVAAKNGIRLEPDDPAFALVTLNRLVLEESANKLIERVSSLLAQFADSLLKAENRAGKVLADEVRSAASEWRKSLNEDLAEVNAKAESVVHQLSGTHTAHVRFRRATCVMISGSLLFSSGVALGFLVAGYLR